jgi:hypothetical protein
MIHTRKVCNLKILRSISCQSQFLNMFRCWIMCLIYFHSKKKSSVISKDWGVSAAFLWLQKKFRCLSRFSCWSSSSKICLSSCLSIWKSYSKNNYVWCPKYKNCEFCLKTSKLRISCWPSVLCANKELYNQFTFFLQI